MLRKTYPKPQKSNVACVRMQKFEVISWRASKKKWLRPFHFVLVLSGRHSLAPRGLGLPREVRFSARRLVRAVQRGPLLAGRARRSAAGPRRPRSVQQPLARCLQTGQKGRDEVGQRRGGSPGSGVVASFLSFFWQRRVPRNEPLLQSARRGGRGGERLLRGAPQVDGRPANPGGGGTDEPTR